MGKDGIENKEEKRKKGWLKLEEENLRRNCLTIRFRDDEHKAVVDTAWRNRQSASGWLRDIVLGYLKAEGIFEGKD